MPGGDHWAVWGCDNDRRYPEKQKILLHVGILRFFSPKNNKDVLSWARAINRDQFKVTTSTKVCSNHFVQGYRTSQCDAQLNMSTVSAQVPVILPFFTCSFTEFEEKSSG